jgi:DNA-binding response OmpR family regulator
MHVLLVEDDEELAARIGRGLSQAGFIVRRAVDGIQGLAFGLQPQVGIIILDLDLRGKSGLELLKEWRTHGLAAPVLVLTGRGAGLDKSGGLHEGADDYLAKPFHLPELIARLHALRSRSWGHASNVLKYDDLTVNHATGEVLRGKELLELTALELRMLKYFMNRTRHVISQDELVEHLYSGSDIRESNTIEVYVSRLRRKIGAEKIKTLRGLGYRFG